MLSVLPVCAVWRGNAEALKVTFSFEGSLTHRQCYRAVFLFLVGSVKRRRGRQVLRQMVCKTCRNQRVHRPLRGHFGYGFAYNLGTDWFSAGFTGFGGDAEVVEAPVCKTGLSGFESRRYLHFYIGQITPRCNEPFESGRSTRAIWRPSPASF